MKLLFILSIFFLGFQQSEYTQSKSITVYNLHDLIGKRILPSSFFDGIHEYQIRPNDLYFNFRTEKEIGVHLPNYSGTLNITGFIAGKKYHILQFQESKNGPETGREGILKLYINKNRLTRIHVEYKSGGGYQFLLQE
jgi:hypothetical protein